MTTEAEQKMIGMIEKVGETVNQIVVELPSQKEELQSQRQEMQAQGEQILTVQRQMDFQGQRGSDKIFNLGIALIAGSTVAIVAGVILSIVRGL